MQYRAEIDGLRALAVIPVILFHAGFQFFSGGFVGVDVFFVISGYLITTIILDELKQGKFSILKFYERRARRILPALFVVLLATLPFALMWLLPTDMRDFSHSLIAVSTFVSNIFFWRTTDYFGTAAELKPLLHTWSLSVEEQYYVFFPVFLILAWKLRWRWILVILGFIGLISLALAQWVSIAQPAAGFFLLPTRGWELLVGASVAFYFSSHSKIDINKNLSELGGFLGLIFLVYSILVFNHQTPFPSFYTLLPVFGTALIILCSNQKTLVGKLLGNKFFVGIGLISYSAYLWHQPLFAFARLRSLTEPGKLLFGLLVIVAMLLAYLSWKYVEAPFRNKSKFNQRQVFIFGTVGTLFFIIFGLVGSYTSGNFFRKDFEGRLSALERKILPNKGLSSDCDNYFTESKSCRTSDEPEVLLWGDSFAMHLMDGILASNPQVKIKQATVASCGPFFSVAPLQLPLHGKAWANNCIESNDKVYEFLKRSKSIKYVVLSSPFDAYVGKDSLVFTREGEVVSGAEYSYTYFENTLEKIKQLGIVPIVFSPPPRNGNNSGQCLLKANYFNKPKSLCDFDLGNANNKYPDVLEFLSRVSTNQNVVWLSDGICNGNVCKASQEGIFFYSDSGHLSHEGSAFLGKKMGFVDLITASK